MLPTPRTIVLALALAAGGCSTADFKSLGRIEPLRDANGHVVGYKEAICDCRKGEEFTRLQLYVPRVDDKGNIVGYEEPVRGRTAILHDLNGKVIGQRYVDLRSRATNPGNRGITVVILSKPAPHLALAATSSTDDLLRLARLAN
jgi:hypothetical protein